MKPTISLICIFLSFNSFAQYTTPNTGVVWNLDSLVLYSDGAVVPYDGDDYQINEDLDISENDSIAITTSSNVYLNEDVTVTVSGSFVANSFGLKFTAVDQNNPYRGFRFEEQSIGVFKDVTLEYGGGFKVLSANFDISMCQVKFNDNIITTGAVIEVSNGKPIISGNFFLANNMSAVSSAANSSVAPKILGNSIQANVMSNTNRPQINMGPSGGADTTYIVNNTIIGFNDNEMAGGIAVSSLVGGAGNVVIKNNFINQNRYGIAIVGNGINALIDNNIIVDNNIQNEPFLGGSGINLNGNATRSAIVSNNLITGNLWGVTIQNAFSANLGDNGVAGFSPGMNIFNNNGNDGELYALFNNTPNEVYAQNNCWTTAEENTMASAEALISHEVDDNTLGEVIFDPLGDCFTGIEEDASIKNIVLYPNPTEDYLNIELVNDFRTNVVEIYGLYGNKVMNVIPTQSETLKINVEGLKPGIYILSLNNGFNALRSKFVKI